MTMTSRSSKFVVSSCLFVLLAFFLIGCEEEPILSPEKPTTKNPATQMVNYSDIPDRMSIIGKLGNLSGIS